MNDLILAVKHGITILADIGRSILDVIESVRKIALLMQADTGFIILHVIRQKNDGSIYIEKIHVRKTEIIHFCQEEPNNYIQFPYLQVMTKSEVFLVEQSMDNFKNNLRHGY